jgi:hypothetical protein
MELLLRRPEQGLLRAQISRVAFGSVNLTASLAGRDWGDKTRSCEFLRAGLYRLATNASVTIL